MALLPIVLVIVTVVVSKNYMPANAGVVFGLALGAISSALLGFKYNSVGLKKSLSLGSTAGGNAIIITATVIGVAAVIKMVPAFQSIIEWLISINVNPYIKEIISVNIISGIVGSSSGGIQVFMEFLGQQYLDLGLNPEAIHRVCTIASGGFDSLPHCSTVVVAFAVMGVTYKEAYRDFGVCTVVIPLIASVVAVIMAMTIYV